MKTIRFVLLASVCTRLIAADPPASGTIAAGPFQLPYRIEGSGSPAIVVGSATYTSRIFSANLRRHLKLVFLDHRVTAPSPGPVDVAEFALDALVDDIERARKQLGLGRITVIGHSGNALIALEYAKKFPANVSHVVMIGIAPDLSAASAASAARNWQESLDPVRKQAMADNLRRLPDEELAMLPPQERSTREYIRNGPKIWYDPYFDATPLWEGVKRNLDGLAHVWGRVLRDIDITQGLAAFDRPVLLALGRYDFIVAPPSSWDPLRPKFKDLTVRVFERSGHTPQYEEPELFDAELLGWLKKKAATSASAARAESGFVQVPGGRLYYETAGTGDTIVLIHGNAGDRRHWDHQVETLAKEFRVIRYDVRGFGRSTCSTSGESYAHHTDLAALLDHLEIKAAHIAGWSMGPAIAIDFALAYPDRIKSLTSVGPWISGFSSSAAKTMFADMGRVQDVLTREGQVAAVAAWMEAPFFAETIRDAAAGAEFQRIASDYTFCRFAHPPQPLEPAAVGRAGEIRVPSLILTADHDIPACLEIADLLHRSVANSNKVVMAGTGHLLHMEKPTEFNEPICCPPKHTPMKPIHVLMLAVLTAPLFNFGQPTATKVREPIIDMHMHARNGPRKLPDGKLMPAPGVAGAPERPAPLYTVPGSILRGTLDKMEKHNIVLGYLSDSQGELFRWFEAAPDRFLVSAAIGGAHLADSAGVETLRSAFAAGKYKAMGEIGTQYRGIAPNDPRLEPYFALADELDIPVLIHMGGLGAPMPGFRSAQGRPTLLEEVVVKHPKLRVYLENAAYPYLDEVVALMTQYPNVYADLSTITWYISRPAFHRYLRALVESGLGKQLMFGSDQMNWPETIDWAIEAIESAAFLTPQQKRDIFYNNAARFLRLSEAEIARHHRVTDNLK